MKKPIIKAENVKKHFKLDGITIKALCGINLQINYGEMISIVGPSGSGKSTLMNLLGCLDKPTSGEICINSKPISKMDSRELAVLRNKEIGFVFQNFNLLNRASAWQNVELPAVYAGLSRTKRKQLAKEKLTEVGLADRLDHLPNQLSGGQQQRVAIARALINDPKIIIADEPTGNLDSKSGEEIIKILKILNKKGKTIILVTHDLDLAGQTKKIIKLKDGLIVN